MPYGILPAMDDEPFNLLGVSAADWAQTPDSVQLALLSLLDIVRGQSGRLRELETLVRELHAKLGQTSRNSSKPPSSDPPSAPPPPPRSARGRKVGGQAGHDGHQRPLVPPDQVMTPLSSSRSTVRPARRRCLPTCRMLRRRAAPKSGSCRRLPRSLPNTASISSAAHSAGRWSGRLYHPMRRPARLAHAPPR